jgi:hypothetical protein
MRAKEKNLTLSLSKGEGEVDSIPTSPARAPRNNAFRAAVIAEMPQHLTMGT